MHGGISVGRWVLLAFLVCLVAVQPPALAGEPLAPAEALAGLERLVLGASPESSLSERVAGLENLIWGHPGQGTLPDRVTALRETVLRNDARLVSLVFRLNAIEWELFHRITGLPLLAKLSGLETAVLGRTGTGPLLARAEEVSAAIWPEGRLPFTRIDLTAGTLVRIRLLADLSSGTNKAGDTFPFVVSQTVTQDDYVALPQGSTGEGRIALIEPPRNMGRDARITLTFGPISALDGTPVRIAAGEACIAANKSLSLTVRVTAAGMIVLGPAGILSGLFVHGKETLLPQGTELFVQTTEVTSCLTLAKGDR